jgi:hypothetical protein
MKEFMTVRYCVDELRRQAREQEYLSNFEWEGIDNISIEPYELKCWFDDSNIKVEESTKTLIQNIFKGKLK